jgi:5-methylcytosine-specific restriction protein A
VTLRPPPWPRCTTCTKPCKPSEQVVHEGNPYCCPDCVILPEGSTSQATLRAQVLARDKGVCVLCHLDVAEQERQLAELKARPDLYAERVDLLVRAGFDRKRIESGSLWDADHIEARVYGGATTLANARTLCVPCHRSVTAELARSRAASRRRWR